MDLIWELRALCAAIVLSLIAPNTGRMVARALARPFRALAVHRKAAIAFVGMLSLAVTVSVGLLAGGPKPYIHDEFAYSLTADTFAYGRLTNPTHPMSEHFETYHVLQTPSYQAKYPPGQGLVMAAGQLLTGRQIAGVWLSVAVACGAVCWMLQGWLPLRWALLGGTLAAIHPTVIVRWGETFWGGAVAMTGGALLYGALPRIKQHLRIRDAVFCGLGLVLLANSRPYEGLVAALPAGVVLLLWLLRDRRHAIATRFTHAATPIVLTLVVGAAGTGYYNYRVTGDALTMPYKEWMNQYVPRTSLSLLLWKKLQSTPDSQQTTSAPHTTGRPDFELASLPPGSTFEDLAGGWGSPGVAEKLLKHHVYFLRGALTLALLTIPLLLHRRDVRLAMSAYIAVALAVIFNACAGHAHYYASATPLLIFLLIQTVRRLRIARIGKLRWGLTAALALVPITAGASWQVVQAWIKTPVPAGYSWVYDRADITSRLTESGGKHLILVHYESGHDISLEWVYNGADLESAPILWARPISPERTRELTAYYSNRCIWRLDADASPPRLTEIRSEQSDTTTRANDRHRNRSEAIHYQTPREVML